jgi:hypothetical protein
MIPGFSLHQDPGIFAGREFSEEVFLPITFKNLRDFTLVEVVLAMLEGWESSRVLFSIRLK